MSAAAGRDTGSPVEPLEVPSLIWIERKLDELWLMEHRWSQELKIIRAMVALIDDRIGKFRELEEAYKADHPEEARESRLRRQAAGY